MLQMQPTQPRNVVKLMWIGMDEHMGGPGVVYQDVHWNFLAGWKRR